MKFIFTLFLSGAMLICTAQKTRKVIVTTESPNTKQIYYVIKGSPQIKHGVYTKTTFATIKLTETGQYSNNVKTGVWEYYGLGDELEQKIDFTSKTILFAKPFTAIVSSVIIEGDTILENTSGQVPVLIGGMSRLSNCLQTTVLYPEAARRAGLEGTVLISATVTRDGRLIDEKVEDGPDKNLNDEALRVVRTLPDDWMPLSIAGKIVKSRITLAIKFTLEK